MKRWIWIALALAACDRPASSPPPVSDFSGLWLIEETDPECKHAFSRCYVDVAQSGDRATVKSWAEGREWTCEGRGTVTGNLLKFRWMAGVKGWRGWAELEMHGDEVKGTYQREDVTTGVQYTRGKRVR